VEDNEKPSPSLRERTRLATQRAISEVAMPMFIEAGFDNVTVDQIAVSAGISPRSFFRYFATKEDVVLGHLATTGLQLRDALVARPAKEPPWDALRAAFGTLLAEYGGSPDSLRDTTRMLYATPSLRARHLEKQLHWQDLLVPEIARRLGTVSTAKDVRAYAIVASAMACLDAAGAAWALSEDAASVEELLDEAIRAVRA
jgi:AcrR family transcriptional regulator